MYWKGSIDSKFCVAHIKTQIGTNQPTFRFQKKMYTSQPICCIRVTCYLDNNALWKAHDTLDPRGKEK